MSFLKIRVITLLLVSLAVSCKKNDSTDNTKPIDLNQARLNDFKLMETIYSDIDISHPELHNGTETKRGRIQVKIPKGSTQLNLTPAISNFTSDAFTITPRLGEMQNFLSKTITYTIASRDNPEKKVHYDVSIVEEDGPVNTQARITGFKFEKQKNPALPADIEAAKIVEGVGTIGKIYVFVPVGTNFSNLTATMQFDGQGLYYTQDANSVPENSTTIYPAAGMSVDFAYPKQFFAVVKAGQMTKTYEVIVDVRNPIKFEEAIVTTADAVRGGIRFISATSFTNQGNHPMMLSVIEHSGQVPAGTNVIRASAGIPSFGLNPNESTVVNATISAQTYPAGSYSVISSFKPKIYHEPDADEFMESSSVTINTTIIN
jgi:hypothetical protein